MLTRPIFCWCWVMNESYQACFSFSYFAYKLIICKPHKWSQIGASVDGWFSGFGLRLFNCFPSLTKLLSLLGGKKKNVVISWYGQCVLTSQHHWAHPWDLTQTCFWSLPVIIPMVILLLATKYREACDPIVLLLATKYCGAYVFI